MKEINHSNVKFAMPALPLKVLCIDMLNQFMKEKKTFKCDICSRGFGMKGTLKNHVKSVHEGNKPFECEVCEAKFAQNCQLKVH